MKISSLVERINAREIRLPEIQRDYVWKSHQIAKLLDSLYRKYPSGSLLLWGLLPDDSPLLQGGPEPCSEAGALRRSRYAARWPGTSLGRMPKRWPVSASRPALGSMFQRSLGPDARQS